MKLSNFSASIKYGTVSISRLERIEGVNFCSDNRVFSLGSRDANGKLYSAIGQDYDAKGRLSRRISYGADGPDGRAWTYSYDGDCATCRTEINGEASGSEVLYVALPSTIKTAISKEDGAKILRRNSSSPYTTATTTGKSAS